MSTFLDGLDPIQLTVLANIFAITLTNGLTSGEIDILSNFLTSIGDLMALISSAQETLGDSSENN